MRNLLRRIPAPLRPLAGSIVLVAGVRLIDAIWQRRRVDTTTGADANAEDRDDAPHVIRDRLVRSLLLTAVTAFAARVGTPEKRSRRNA